MRGKARGNASTDRPIDGEEPPFEPPPRGIDWSVPARFNVWAWNDVSDSTPAHSGPPETYDPADVHPTLVLPEPEPLPGPAAPATTRRMR